MDAVTMPDCLETDNNSCNRMSVVCIRISNFIFMSGKVNRYKFRLWESENPHFYQEHTRESEKVYVCRAKILIGPFLSVKVRINGNIFVDTLESFTVSQLENLQPNMMFQLNDASLIADTLWLSRRTLFKHIPWPMRSLSITPCDFFVWDFL